MPEPTVEQVLNIGKEEIRKPSPLIPVLAFIFLPPWGVYLLWKEKSFHAIFSILIFLLGLLNLLSAVSLLFISQGFSTILIVTTISLLQMSGSFYFYRQAKSRGYLEVSELVVLATTALLVDFVIIPLLFGFLFFQVLQPYIQQNLDPYKAFPVN